MNLNGCSRKLCPMQVGCTDYCRLTKEQCPYYTQDIDVQKALNLIKAEVAREIFDDLEKIFDSYGLGYFNSHLKRTIDELKKKYTEGKT